LNCRFTYNGRSYSTIQCITSSIHYFYIFEEDEDGYGIANVSKIEDSGLPPSLATGINAYMINNGFGGLDLQEYLEQLGVLDH
jgi:hypothetical protein